MKPVALPSPSPSQPATTPAQAPGSTGEQPWLFSRRLDLWAFGGSALLSLCLLGVGAALGLLQRDAPPWVFLLCVLAVDVAHVWSTLFRVYLDAAERARRPLLYYGLPLACFGVAWAVHSWNPGWFWRGLAYLAVYHFVRQQLGFLQLYQRRTRQPQWERRLEQAALLAAMLHPLLYWHTHLPTDFAWMMEGDFIAGLPPALALYTGWVSYALLAAVLTRQLYCWPQMLRSPGRCLLITTTALCWYLGIVVFPSDYAFTVTNVLIHGIPYGLLTYYYATQRTSRGKDYGASWPFRRPLSGLAYFLGMLWTLAWLEEWLWHLLVFQDQSALFGLAEAQPGVELWVPLLAVPQLTHYLLDGLIWKRHNNPLLADVFAVRPGQSPSSAAHE